MTCTVCGQAADLHPPDRSGLVVPGEHWRCGMRPADIARPTSTPDLCPECGGAGELRHPRWGAYDCPAPTITCPRCEGEGR